VKRSGSSARAATLLAGACSRDRAGFGLAWVLGAEDSGFALATAQLILTGESCRSEAGSRRRSNLLELKKVPERDLGAHRIPGGGFCNAL